MKEVRVITIEQLGTEMKKLSRDIEVELNRVDIPLFNKTVNRLGNLALRKMRNTIKISKVRPGGSNNLENTIDISYFPEGGWGVGHIPTLNIQASYWHFINFGVSIKGMTIPGRGKFVPMGAFSPGVAQPSAGAFRQGRWQVGSGQFSFKAGKGIPAMNYISRTAHYLNGLVDRLVRR